MEQIKPFEQSNEDERRETQGSKTRYEAMPDAHPPKTNSTPLDPQQPETTNTQQPNTWPMKKNFQDLKAWQQSPEAQKSWKERIEKAKKHHEEVMAGKRKPGPYEP